MGCTGGGGQSTRGYGESGSSHKVVKGRGINPPFPVKPSLVGRFNQRGKKVMRCVSYVKSKGKVVKATLTACTPEGVPREQRKCIKR